MRFIFTKSKLPFSGFERWILDEDCSHMQVVFDCRSTGIVFDIYFSGSRIRFLKDVLAGCEIVHSIELNLTVEQEDAVFDLMVEKFDGQSYAFKAAIYLGYRKVMNRLFGWQIPPVNPYLGKNEMFCDMVYGIVEAIGIPVASAMNGMQSPHDVFLSAQGKV